MRLGAVLAIVGLSLAAAGPAQSAVPRLERCKDDRAARRHGPRADRLSGAASGRLRIAWDARAVRATARLRGSLGGRRVYLRTPAP